MIHEWRDTNRAWNKHSMLLSVAIAWHFSDWPHLQESCKYLNKYFNQNQGKDYYRGKEKSLVGRREVFGLH